MPVRTMMPNFQFTKLNRARFVWDAKFADLGRWIKQTIKIHSFNDQV